MPDHTSRREFLVASTLAGSGWLAFGGSLLGALAACAREDAATGAALTTLTAPEGRTLRAFAARILPSDDGTPGAEEAGAIHFIDRALGSYFTPMRELIGAGAADLDTRAATATPPAASFADLSTDAQDALMRDVEQEPWFGAARFLVLAGVFSDPSYGGNRDNVGDRLLGIERAPSYQPPFGYYDAQPMAEGGAA